MLCWNDTTNFACRDRQEGRGERAKGSLAREKGREGCACKNESGGDDKIYVLFCCAVSMFIFSLYCVGALAFWRTGQAPLSWCRLGSPIVAAAGRVDG